MILHKRVQKRKEFFCEMCPYKGRVGGEGRAKSGAIFKI